MNVLINYIRKLFLSPIIAYKWGKALESASNDEFDKSNRLLIQIAPYFSNKMVEYHLLKGFVSFVLNNDRDSIENFKTSINLLNTSSKYNETEKKYISCYASTFGIQAAKKIPNITVDDVFNNLSFDDINLSNVRNNLKVRFPLRRHPNWTAQ